MHPFKHFKTITRHRHKVIYNCIRCGIVWQGLRHDLSKYTPTEFIPGCRYYTGTRSPNEIERQKFGYSLAWMHHKGRNRHHFEYWVDFNPKLHQNVPVKMPFRYVVEMFCDRVAASKIYQGKNYNDGSALAYYKKGSDVRFIHPETAALLEKLLEMLEKNGEDETFSYIRTLVKSHYNY